MARKYIKKYPKKLSQVFYASKLERDGHRYFICKLPFGFSEEELEYWLGSIKRHYLTFVDWNNHRGRWKKKHGEMSGRRQKYLDRDRLIYEIWKKQKQKGVKSTFPYEDINRELRKKKYLKKGEELSDERLRKIISSFIDKV